MTIWQEGRHADEPGGVSLKLWGPPQAHTLSDNNLDTQLVIWEFRVKAHGHRPWWGLPFPRSKDLGKKEENEALAHGESEREA